jgi:hypothetical protein
MIGTLRRMRSRIKRKFTSIRGNKAHKVKKLFIILNLLILPVILHVGPKVPIK